MDMPILGQDFVGNEPEVVTTLAEADGNVNNIELNAPEVKISS